MIKIYEPKYISRAKHEQFLEQSLENNFALFQETHSRVINDYFCVLFEINNFYEPVNKDYSTCLVSLFSSLWALPPTNQSLKAYMRTHPFSITNFHVQDLDIMDSMKVTDVNNANLKYLQSNFEDIKSFVACLPMAIDNKSISKKTILVNELDDRILCSQWGRWTIEPIGASIAHLGNVLEDHHLDAIILQIKKHRKDCLALNSDALRLSGAFHRIHALIIKRQYFLIDDAISRLVNIYQGLSRKN